MKQVLALDTSQIVQFSKCPLSWILKYKQGLVPASAKLKYVHKDGNTKFGTYHLDMGTVIHNLLDCYYTMVAVCPKENPKNLVSAVLEAVLTPEYKDMFEFTEEKFQFLQLRFITYHMVYSATKSDFKPLMQKDKPAVEVGFSKVLYEDDKKMYVVEGRIDLINCTVNPYTWKKELAIVDHKTQEQTRNLYHYKPQFMTYCWAAGIPRFVVNYIGLQQKHTEDTFRRVCITIPEQRIALWVKQLKIIYDTIWDVQGMLAAGVNERQFANFLSCGGEFESMPCAYSMACDNVNDSAYLQIKKNMYVENERWRPW